MTLSATDKKRVVNGKILVVYDGDEPSITIKDISNPFLKDEPVRLSLSKLEVMSLKDKQKLDAVKE